MAPALEQRAREIVRPGSVGVTPPLRGRYLRPRSIVIDQTPAKILDVDPDRLGAWIFNNGGQIELPVPLPQSSTGLALALTLDSASVQVPAYAPSTYKSLYLIVDTALAWVTAAQAKIQLIVGRQPWSAVSGAASGAGGDTQNALKGAQVNLGGAGATSLARGLYPFSPTDIADLQWQVPYIGAELTFGSALTAGAARLFLETPGGPNLLIGEDNLINIDQQGNPAGAFVVPSQAPAQWIQPDGELWAAASRGGTLDVRIWEVLIEGRSPARLPYA